MQTFKNKDSYFIEYRSDVEYIWQQILSGNIILEWPDDFIIRSLAWSDQNKIPSDILSQFISLPVFMEFWSDCITISIMKHANNCC